MTHLTVYDFQNNGSLPNIQTPQNTPLISFTTINANIEHNKAQQESPESPNK